MIFHENRLLTDDSHVISYLIFVQKFGKMSQNLSSAAFVICALRVNEFAHINTSVLYCIIRWLTFCRACSATSLVQAFLFPFLHCLMFLALEESNLREGIIITI